MTRLGFVCERKYPIFIIINNLEVLLTFEFEDTDSEQLAHYNQDVSPANQTDARL